MSLPNAENNMNIFTKDFTPPTELITDTFCIFPTSDKFYQSDYVTVMRNASMLRIWSQSSWPEDDFTPQQNKADLAQHIDDNHTHAAYGFMIYSPDHSKCYGSVYVNPISNVAENYIVNVDEKKIIDAHHARIDYWVIEEDSHLEKEITQKLKNWFNDTWKIKTLFSARLGLEKRLYVYRELNYSCQLNLKSKTSDMSLLLFSAKESHLNLIK